MNDLLRGVSRSFYLSIRLLPPSVRRPVGLAYLLARATDTVADAAEAPVADRLALLGAMTESLTTGRGPDTAAIAGSVAQADERELLRRWPDCLSALRELPEADRADIETVLGHIVQGQALDLQRFPGALTQASELRDYTYLVAGCVGEFWTDLCARHFPDFAERPLWQMRELGRSFGMGLQLVNVLRDAQEDMAAGRQYLPGDVDTVWPDWAAEAEERLEDGMRYAQAVKSRRIRAAVALPALIGRRTLHLLHSAGPTAPRQRIKVPRAEVRAMLVRTALGAASRKTLQAQWDNAAR